MALQTIAQLSPQQTADHLLIAYQDNRHLPHALRAQAIDDALLVVANSNSIAPADALYHAQQQAVANVMGGL